MSGDSCRRDGARGVYTLRFSQLKFAEDGRREVAFRFTPKNGEYAPILQGPPQPEEEKPGGGAWISNPGQIFVKWSGRPTVFAMTRPR